MTEPESATNTAIVQHTEQLDSLRLQMEYRWKVIKFMLVIFTSFSVFSVLTILTGLSYEYTNNRGDKFAYRFPTEELVKLLSVPVVASVATAIVGVMAKDKR